MAQKTRTVVLQQSDEGSALRLELPVNPQSITLTRPQNLLTYQTVAGETMQMARGSGLRQVSLETFLPGEHSPFYQGTAPEEGLALLEGWMQAGTPVRLMISGVQLDELFLIAELRQSLQEGDEDMGIVIVLKEYKYISLLWEDDGSQSAGGLLERTDERETPGVYVTLGGEDLWSIAHKLLGSGREWKTLARRNGISDPHNLPAGKEIYLS